MFLIELLIVGEFRNAFMSTNLGPGAGGSYIQPTLQPMAVEGITELLHDKALNRGVLKLIDNARQFLILITPYFDPNDVLEDFLRKAVSRNVQICLIVRHEPKTPHDFIQRLCKIAQHPCVTVKWVEWLHAKIYVSEKEAIISSLNLLKSSFQDSIESGTRFVAPSELYRNTKGRADYIEMQSKIPDFLLSHTSAGSSSSSSAGSAPPPAMPFAFGSGSPTPKPASTLYSLWPVNAMSFSSMGSSTIPSPPAKKQSAFDLFARNGHCINCCTVSVLTIDIRPLCGKCYKSHRSTSFEKNFRYCHVCGKDEPKKSMQKPLCRNCWQEFGHNFNFLE